MIKNKLVYLLVGLLLGFVAMIFIFAVVAPSNEDQAYQKLFARNTRIFIPETPASAIFCNEAAPLDHYFVHEAFEREIITTSFMHTSTILMFKRANRFFPTIEPILKRNGIPDDFKYLAVAESNLGNVTSPAGAEGFWQFMKITGQQYGLEINGDVDERYNLEKATEAACKYLKDSYDIFKNWTLVAASYNRGMDGMKKAIEKQHVKNYYDLYLNDETARYLFRILAFKEIWLHPVKYGFYLHTRDFYPPIPTRTITVDSAIHDLPAFAKGLKINYRILRELNPWIQGYALPNKTRKRYTILLPVEGATSYKMLMKRLPKRDLFFHDTLRINEIN